MLGYVRVVFPLFWDPLAGDLRRGCEVIRREVVWQMAGKVSRTVLGYESEIEKLLGREV